jgi:hypothetical protein
LSLVISVGHPCNLETTLRLVLRIVGLWFGGLRSVGDWRWRSRQGKCQVVRSKPRP